MTVEFDILDRLLTNTYAGKVVRKDMLHQIKGGENVGAHLGLLGIFLPGYSVTVAGSLIGFVYAFVIGYAFGRIIGLIYNWLSRPRAW